VQQLGGSVLFPAMSETVREDPASLERKLKRARETVFRASSVVVPLIAFGAPLFFALLYDPRYDDCGWIAQIIACVLCIRLLEETVTPVFLSLADTRMTALSNFAQSAGGIGGSVAGYFIAGLPGFLIGRACGPLASEVLALWKLKRWRVNLIGQDSRAAAMITTLTLTAVGMELGLSHAIGGASGIVLRVAMGGGLGLGLLFSVGRPLLDQVRASLVRFYRRHAIG
jgi:O-antigen/teichoic acid export membrane protein